MKHAIRPAGVALLREHGFTKKKQRQPRYVEGWCECAACRRRKRSTGEVLSERPPNILAVRPLLPHAALLDTLAAGRYPAASTETLLGLRGGQKDAIVRLRTFGYTYGAIAERFGISGGYVQQVVATTAPHLRPIMQDDLAATLEALNEPVRIPERTSPNA